jgi:hypothetical protein
VCCLLDWTYCVVLPFIRLFHSLGEAVIGRSFEFIWTTNEGESGSIEVGDHESATHKAFYFGKTRRVGTRYQEDSITFWNPGKLGDKDVITVFIDDLDTLNIRKLTDEVPIPN